MGNRGLFDAVFGSTRRLPFTQWTDQSSTNKRSNFYADPR